MLHRPRRLATALLAVCLLGVVPSCDLLCAQVSYAMLFWAKSFGVWEWEESDDAWCRLVTMKLQGGYPYAMSVDGPPKKERVLAVGSKGEAASATAVLAREERGPYDAVLEFVHGSSDGFVDGQTTVSLMIQRPDGEDGWSTRQRVDAVYTEALMGWRAAGWHDGQPVGVPVDLWVEHDVALRVSQTATEVTLAAAPTVVSQLEGGDWTTIAAAPLPLGDDPFRVCVQVQGLGKKGRVGLRQLRMRGEELGGVVERPLMNQVGLAIAHANEALAAMGAQSPDLGEAASCVDDALAELDQSIDAVVAAAEAGALQDSTDVQRAVKRLQRTRARMAAVGKASTAAAAGGKPGAAVKLSKRLERASGMAEAAIAHLAGVRRTTLKKPKFVATLP